MLKKRLFTQSLKQWSHLTRIAEHSLMQPHGVRGYPRTGILHTLVG